ncbi:MAG: ornithine carbamoyltransferase [Acidimicrobiaceae bacterium]|nr:ornithine carbamoyltransferase [Acidimicrobiaceae bacterium]MCY4175216.1 ornithine carbamoyltransferase [Acidimicrobiaceae bacterium]MCY4279261.1 ornithine carbamoyltransferase [Acidimicrobiaceae bacterium]MCY4294669.1 ornithine carbamoyltransferase [Acidimicrobiaceae bacterium]
MIHLLDIDSLTANDVSRILNLADDPSPFPVLAGRGAALLFEKPSARTRSALEMAVVQLGGHPIYISASEVGLDERESVEDVTRVLAGYNAVIGARVFDHRILERMVAVSGVPVVNLLSDRAHPTQALADLLTMRAEFGQLEGLTLGYVGDANNVARSLALAAGLSGVAVRVASPRGYGFSESDLRDLRRHGCEPVQVTNPREAVGGADVVYTDAWTSMGQETQAEQRRRDFAGFTVNRALMSDAADSAVFMHCLPAHRGEEVEAAVIDGPRSRVWPQAANRMHAARALLMWLSSHDEDARSQP